MASSCSTTGKFFSRNAVVYYKIPNNFKDYLAQSIRFLTIKSRLFEYFSPKIEKEYRIPLKIKIKSLVRVFLKKPFYLTAGVLLQIIVRLNKNSFKEEYENGVWKTAESSK